MWTAKSSEPSLSFTAHEKRADVESTALPVNILLTRTEASPRHVRTRRIDPLQSVITGTLCPCVLAMFGEVSFRCEVPHPVFALLFIFTESYFFRNELCWELLPVDALATTGFSLAQLVFIERMTAGQMAPYENRLW
ncbi:hypothetical protein OE88DRAFT_143533 [Heliocybe sulcata]|uniref:Uncharacterized protein n=1 Tax=Heliocybe sulcata TaxID=5364 RepID=A0A5C3NHW3_9AGAM|nr:hypothetical protein OE88DRAFT_143533 [Heliocybe sulcata]